MERLLRGHDDQVGSLQAEPSLACSHPFNVRSRFPHPGLFVGRGAAFGIATFLPEGLVRSAVMVNGSDRNSEFIRHRPRMEPSCIRQ